jgi:type VI secretion system protein ImpA
VVYKFDGKIRTREEAILALDGVCAYYAENEPSSPLPMLIRRAKRLASKSFIEILQDLLPDSVDRAQSLRGPEQGNESG